MFGFFTFQAFIEKLLPASELSIHPFFIRKMAAEAFYQTKLQVSAPNIQYETEGNFFHIVRELRQKTLVIDLDHLGSSFPHREKWNGKNSTLGVESHLKILLYLVHKELEEFREKKMQHVSLIFQGVKILFNPIFFGKILFCAMFWGNVLFHPIFWLFCL